MPVSVRLQELSLSGACTCEAGICTATRSSFPLEGLGPDHCSRSLEGSGHGAPASKADCVLRAGKCFWPVHLCAALRVREWEQFGTHGVWRGATVSCGPTNGRGGSLVRLLQIVQAGQGKSCERAWYMPGSGPPQLRGAKGMQKGLSLFCALCFKSSPNHRPGGSVQIPGQFGPTSTMQVSPRYVSTPPPTAMIQKPPRGFSGGAGTQRLCQR